MTVQAVLSDEVERLQTRVRELEHERKHLLAIIEILQELAGSLHFVDIMQSIARRLGEAFGLDRSSIFLAERDGRTARLVASFEDPSIRNYVVDLDRYPELRRALTDGETVYIPDVELDPTMAHLKGAFDTRKVRSITVVPITWRGVSIGAILLRTFRDGPAFSEADVRFCQVVASLTAKALRNAHRFEKLQQRVGDTSSRAVERERVALVGFLRRLLDEFAAREGPWSEGVLAKASAEEIERLVGVALTVLQQEAAAR
ncbi:MAG: GAF domain-containing protein [Gemmatimonadales bacterium]|jgi:two-component system sensor histidine kinase ChiS|nr:GAF domain-containing protein [Gemmatimonadota bacterium]MBK7783943.1 GAF domain-containing protein [Gemmatimonadota bacterium]MBK9068010.1 GAF domain-containing protein [Gemmatimonadota bacterium]MBP6669431.1 GAF domain-containing protein [Gemmatimonadales bacterium]